MPKGRRYTAEDGAFRLTRFRELPADREIRALVSSGAEGVADVDPYDLVHFAKRAGLLAAREQDFAWGRAGLSMLRFLDPAVIDRRDVKWSIAVLWHCTVPYFDEAERAWASDLGAPSQVNELVQAVRRHPGTLESWGFRMIDGSTGLTLMPWARHPYFPRTNLIDLALTLIDELGRGRYRMSDPQAATELPKAWLKGGPLVEAARLALRGCVTLRGDLGTEIAANRFPVQSIIIFLGEALLSEHAMLLARDVRIRLGGRRVRGVVSESLIGVVVAGSFQVGVEMVETEDGLQEIANIVHHRLREGAPSRAAG